MNLPIIDLPIAMSLELPFLIHPIFVHFAIVLPVAVLLIEVVNLLTKRKALSVSAYILLSLTVGIYLLTYLSGKSDASENFALFDEETQTLIKEHRNLGAYLLYFSILPILFKVLSLIKKSGLLFAYFLVLVLFITATFFQGKDGAALVYEQGVNVSALELKDDRIEELEDELEELRDSLVEEGGEVLDAAENNASIETTETTELNSSEIAIPSVVVDTLIELNSSVPTTEINTTVENNTTTPIQL